MKIDCRLAACVILLLSHSFIHGEGNDEKNTRFALKTISELSESHVSRHGDSALNFESIQWEHGETEHFILHFEKGFLPTQLAMSAESFYESIKKQLEVAEEPSNQKSHVYVFLNEEAWRNFIRGLKLDVWTGGFYSGRELFFHSRPNPKFQGSTLPHELTHLVLYRFLGGNIPLWLNEGFAEFQGRRLQQLYLKARDYNAKKYSFRLSSDQFIPVTELTGMTDYPRGEEQVAAFYNESERLINFLHHHHGGMQPLARFIRLQCQGRSFETALLEVYGGKFSSLEDFDARFRVYASKDDTASSE